MASNDLLKRANELVEYTPDDIKELERCSQDPIHFIENYCKIEHPTRGIIPFALYDYQKEILKGFLDNRFVLMEISRQMGKTTLAAAFFLWYASFEEHKTILIVSNKESNALEFIHRVQVMYEYLPKWLKPGITADGWNKKSVGFDNGCRIISRATTESAARGLSLSLVFADELAFVRDNIQEDFWSALSPTLATGGSLIVASTPDGDNNLFARLSREASAGLNEFKYYKYIWSDNPTRDTKWKDSEMRRLGKDKFYQEHECKHLSNKKTLVSSLVLQQQVHPQKPINVLREFKIWEEFQKEVTYIISIDPSTGTGSDFSVIEVFKFPQMVQVAEFRDNVVSSPMLYKILKSIIKYMSQTNCTIYWSIENNGIGEGIIALYEQDDNPPDDAEFITPENSRRLGFHTSNQKKVKFAIQLREMIENGKITFNSECVLTELKNYIRSRNGFEAKQGSTDDCISSTLIALQIFDEIIMYDEAAFDSLNESLNEDYFENYDEDSDDDFAPMVF